jgi:hypothetical protein
LSRSRSFPCKKHKDAIYCWKNWGPDFGVAELKVYEEPFNKPDACWSHNDSLVYRIPVNSEDINMLTNKKKTPGYSNLCKFTITEIEVWGVTFIE